MRIRVLRARRHGRATFVHVRGAWGSPALPLLAAERVPRSPAGMKLATNLSNSWVSSSNFFKKRDKKKTKFEKGVPVGEI
jgi:hypothetical protein